MMNERIRELLEQAGVKYVTMPKDTVYEKFAELIVRECCDKFIEMQHKFHPSICAYEIKQHFGIEE
jgi:hypothetical protein